MAEITSDLANTDPAIYPSIVAVVTCTDRKKAPIPEPLRARELPRWKTRARARAWTRRLEANRVRPGATLIVAASKSYLIALRDDLIAAKAELKDSPGRLIIISAGTKTCPGLDDELLPLGAETQAELGGSRMSLNVRICRHLIRT